MSTRMYFPNTSLFLEYSLDYIGLDWTSIHITWRDAKPQRYSLVEPKRRSFAQVSKSDFR